jgi:hypothetical protein
MNCPTPTVLALLLGHLLLVPPAWAVEPAPSALVKLVIGQGADQRECKGVAVSAQTVLTAAHCVDAQPPWRLQLETELGIASVVQIELHPAYSRQQRIASFDIALLRSSSAIFAHPLPIVVTSRLGTGNSFQMLEQQISDQTTSVTDSARREFRAADVELLLLQYIEYRKGTFPKEAIAEQVEHYMREGNTRIKQKIAKEFGNFIFSLYRESRYSICLGDSGSPAIVSIAGQLGVIGLATAVGQLEAEVNPDCPAGATSIFTALYHPQTIEFLRAFDPAIKFL